jgi:hypothetical protein
VGNIALQVRRRCLAFTPTPRDRSDLIAAGADSELLAAIATCAGRAASLGPRPAAALRVIAPARVSAAAGAEVTIAARVLRGSTPQRGVSVVLRGTTAIPGGTAQLPGALTDARGVATFRILAGMLSGSWPLEVETQGEGTARARVLLVTTVPALTVDVLPNVIVVREGSRVAAMVRVMVRDAGGGPAAGVPLELRGVSAQLASPLTATSDAGGAALFAILPGALRAAGTLGVFAHGAQLAAVVARIETAVVSEDRTQFVAGAGQRGTVHTTLRSPLVLEVRDTAGAPVTGYAVRFTPTNAQVTPATVATDSSGLARVTVTLGDRAGPVVIAASVGRVTRSINFFATPGPARSLVIESQGKGIDRLDLATRDPVTLRAVARDEYGNEALLTGLAASIAGSAAGLRNLRGAATAPGTIVVEPRRGGSASLAVTASGLSTTLPLQVTLPVARSGWVYGARAGGAAFNYDYKGTPGVNGRPGVRGELLVGRRIVPGLRLEGGVGLGVLRARAGTASLAVPLFQGLVRGEYELTRNTAAVPVLSLGGGLYRVKSTDPTNRVYHTSLFWLIGAGVDYPLGPRLQGELRLERQQLYEANSSHLNGSVGALTLLEIGVRVHP